MDAMEADPPAEKMPKFRYQRENRLDKALPYYDKINDEAQAVFAEIKTNLGKAAMMREVNPGCRFWILRLRMYLNVYDIRISKEDHITLIKLFYEMIISPGMDSCLIFEEVLAAMQALLRKPELISPEDLELPWKPLYDIYLNSLHPTSRKSSSYHNHYSATLQDQLYSFIVTINKYFPISATEEILATVMPTICPLDKNQTIASMRALTLFLPTMPRHADAGKGHLLWMKELFSMWEVCNNTSCLDIFMMKLLARLARENAGRIDWEPYMDIMFTRILRGLKLPVTYTPCARAEPQTSTDNAAGWIIAVLGGGSSAQKHLTELLKALESYFYPANSGVWVCKLHGLVSSLPEILLKRLFYERKRDLRWLPPIPEEKRLTEEDITEFVESLRPILMVAINSSNTRYQFLRALYSVAWLRPDIIIPPVLERLYQSVNSQTEPHRVSSGLMFAGAVVRPMVEGARLGYADGPQQVIPLLMVVSTCIDPNDIVKTTFAFVLMARILTCVPLVDCSQEIGQHQDMTPGEEELCRSTAELEDFLMQMIDRMLSLVQYTSSENVRHEQKNNTNNKMDSVIQATTSAMTKRLLFQASPKFFKAALYKLHAFITSTILESAVPLLGSIVSGFMAVNAEETLKMLLPPLTDAILSSTESEDVQQEQTLSSELMYNLGLLKHLTECGPLSKLLPYMDTLHKVLERTLHLENFDGHFNAQKVLGNIVRLPTTILALNLRSSAKPYDTQPGEYLHIRDWGRSFRVQDLNTEWHVPGPEEFDCVQDLVNKFLPPELECIENFIQGNPVKREKLQRSLRIIKALAHCQPLMPFWKEDPLVYPDTVAPDNKVLKVETGLTGEITMPDGSNMRLSLINIIQRLQKKLLTSAEDDTLSCALLIEVWKFLLLYWIPDVSWQQYKDITKWERDPLSLPNLTRFTQMAGATVQAAYRSSFFSTPLTATHSAGLRCILQLATSRYSKVRKSAQGLLNQMGMRFYIPLLYKLLLPDILNNLKQDAVEHHELFKGTLYVLSNINMTYDWTMSGQLWTELVKSKPTEKLSVIRKLEEITVTLLKLHPIDSVKFEIGDSFVHIASDLWDGLPAPLEPLPSSEAVSKASVLHTASNAASLQKWTELQIELVRAAQSSSVHWRHAYLAMACLHRILVEEERSPPVAVQYLLHSLISDNIHIRKVAVRCVCVILQQQKQKTKFNVVNQADLGAVNGPIETVGDNRPDALWLQYDKDKRPLTEEQWEKQRFVHKEFVGYLMWPEEVKIPCPSSEQPPLDGPSRHLQEDEKEVDKFFLSEKNIALLMSFYSLEKKSHSEFSYIVYLFGKLLRNTGDKYLPLLKPHIESLLEEKQDTHQMFLFELLAGIIRGTKRWPFKKLQSLWEWLDPVIRAAQENVCVVDDASLPLRLATSHLKRDPYTQHWLIEILMDDPLRDGASVLGCRRVLMVKSILAQKHWRVTSLSHRLLEYVKPFLAHPYKNVRNCVGMLLGKIFTLDIQLPGAQPTLGPHLADFIASVLPEMEVLKSLNTSVCTNDNSACELKVDEVAEQLDKVEVGSSKEDSALRLFKTVSACMQELLYNSPMALHPSFYELYELSTLLENRENKELKDICQKNLTLLSAAFTLPQHIPAALKAIRKVDASLSWSMRASCLSFLQVLVFQNMPIFRSRDDWVQEVVSLVVQRLDDVWLEVQQKAGEVLGGLLHCHFIPNSDELLENLKKKSATKLVKKSAPDPIKLRQRHAGVIGLCAYVGAFPYDVPDFVPEIIGILGAHLTDPHPIPTTIRKTLSNFQRTHTADWQTHRLRFTEEQLNALSDMVLPPSHYV